MAGPRSAGQCAAGRDRVRCDAPQLQGPARGVCALTGVSDGLAHAPASVLGPQRRAKRSNAHFLHARAALRQTRLSDRCTAMYKPRMQRPRAQQARWSARGHAPTFFWGLPRSQAAIQLCTVIYALRSANCTFCTGPATQPAPPLHLQWRTDSQGRSQRQPHHQSGAHCGNKQQQRCRQRRRRRRKRQPFLSPFRLAAAK